MGNGLSEVDDERGMSAMNGGGEQEGAGEECGGAVVALQVLEGEGAGGGGGGGAGCAWRRVPLWGGGDPALRANGSIFARKTTYYIYFSTTEGLGGVGGGCEGAGAGRAGAEGVLAGWGVDGVAVSSVEAGVGRGWGVAGRVGRRRLCVRTSRAPAQPLCALALSHRQGPHPPSPPYNSAGEIGGKMLWYRVRQEESASSAVSAAAAAAAAAALDGPDYMNLPRVDNLKLGAGAGAGAGAAQGEEEHEYETLRGAAGAAVAPGAAAYGTARYGTLGGYGALAGVPVALHAALHHALGGAAEEARAGDACRVWSRAQLDAAFSYPFSVERQH